MSKAVDLDVLESVLDKDCPHCGFEIALVMLVRVRWDYVKKFWRASAICRECRGSLTDVVARAHGVMAVEASGPRLPEGLHWLDEHRKARMKFDE